MTKVIKPDYEVFMVKDFGSPKEKKSKWTKVGAGWTHQDGEGMNIQLDAVPVDGKLNIRKYRERNESS